MRRNGRRGEVQRDGRRMGWMEWDGKGYGKASKTEQKQVCGGMTGMRSVRIDRESGGEMGEAGRWQGRLGFR